MNSSLNYSYIPQKTKIPIYAKTTLCPKCGSGKSYPIANMPSSPLICIKCKNSFKPELIGYK